MTTAQRPPRSDGAAYMQWYRSIKPRTREYDLAAQAARRRAHVRLASRYPQEMQEILDEERRKAGLE